MFIREKIVYVVLIAFLLSTLLIVSDIEAHENPVNMYSENTENGEDVTDRRSYSTMGRFGDVSGDDMVTVSDAIIILRHVVGLADIGKDYGEDALIRAEVSRSSDKLSVADAILILRYVVGLIDEFPAERPWNTEESKTLAIDQPGGEIDLPDGSRLSFPENALPDTAEVSLGKILPDEDVAEEEIASSFYNLRGFPENINEPVELVVPLEKEVHGETFIVWGEEILGESEHSRILGRQLLPAEVDEEEGVARAVIEPDETEASGGYSLQSSGGGRDIIYHALTGQATLKSRNGNFATTFPAYLVGDDFAAVIENINNAMEDAYEFITDEVGMSFEGGRDVIPVSVFEFNNTYMGGYRSETAWGYAETERVASRRSRDYISINERMLGHSDAENQLRATAAHELFHLFQYLYVAPPRTGWGSDPVGWLREASSVWLELELVEDPGFWPDVVGLQSYFFPVSGLMRPDDSDAGDAAEHGYASSLFLQHLTAKKGNAAIRRMWDELRAGGSDSRAFEAAFETPVWYMTEWLDFCRDFYSGAYLAPDAALHAWGLNNTSRSDAWTVDNPFEDNYKEFQQSYHSLSARIFVVNLHYSEREFDTGEDGTLVITGDENVSLAVFRRSGDGNMEYLGTSFNENEPFEMDNLGLRGPETLVILSVSDWLSRSLSETRDSVITVEIEDLPEVVFTNPAEGESLDTDEDGNIRLAGRMDSETYENPVLSLEDIRIYRYTRENDHPGETGFIRPRKIPVAVDSYNMNHDGSFTVNCHIPDAEQVYALLAVLEFDDEEEIFGTVLLGSPDEMEYTSQGETITWSVNGLDRIFPYGDSGYTFSYESPREGTAPDSVTVSASLTASLWESGKTYFLGISVRTQGVDGDEGLRDENRQEVEWLEDEMYAPDPEFNVALTTNYLSGDSYNIMYLVTGHGSAGVDVSIPFSIQPAPAFNGEEIIHYYHVDTKEPEESDDE